MEFQDVVRTRRMVRRFSDEAVPQAAVDRMVRNATRAPSAGFSQGWAFVVLDRPDDVARFWHAVTPPARAAAPDRWLRGMRTAPVIIAALSSESAYLDRYAEPDKGETERQPRWGVPYWHIDSGMASLLILQTAVDEGLGACFFGIPAAHTDAFRGEFGVPATYMPIGAIAVGHPADGPALRGSPARRARRPLDEVVHHGSWSSGRQP